MANMADLAPEGCTHNCSTCGSSCATPGEKTKPSFFDRLEAVSEQYEKIGEDGMLDMLNELVAELEKEDL